MLPSVLVVESDPLTRLTLVYMLDALKYRVIDAKDHDIALNMLRGVWFDVMIVSLASNDPDGQSIAWEAKALQSHLKVVVASGISRARTLDSTVDAFLQKPFSLDQIDAVVKTLLPLGNTQPVAE
jgi:DNA-binding response OmpR family regulator